MEGSDTYICVLCGQPEAQSIDLYCRKSKLVRGHRQELSTDAQKEQGHRRAHREGYAVRKVWKDIASGYKDVERADFDRALKALAGGDVPALWAYAVDRFSRKGAEDLLKVIGKAQVIFDMDGLDSNEPRDRRWIINRAEEAREYSENLPAGSGTPRKSSAIRGCGSPGGRRGVTRSPVTGCWCRTPPRPPRGCRPGRTCSGRSSGEWPRTALRPGTSAEEIEESSKKGRNSAYLAAWTANREGGQ
ncbi:hypothetical protein ABH930_006836 [Kitasatospora sp. GAS204A]|uniref:recombinase family protein n=1 Tax=unclassified Kitasatospora TaxID=2633591 RepID=UPI0024747004|nr:recombinase family protein [Kitasatospora sp. GAS204B]MDH6122557.1 hypothetical protein [Kitasatospora sp. GAS204B]